MNFEPEIWWYIHIIDDVYVNMRYMQQCIIHGNIYGVAQYLLITTYLWLVAWFDLENGDALQHFESYLIRYKTDVNYQLKIMQFVPTTLTLDSGVTRPPPLLAEADLLSCMDKVQKKKILLSTYDIFFFWGNNYKSRISGLCHLLNLPI